MYVCECVCLCACMCIIFPMSFSIPFQNEYSQNAMELVRVVQRCLFREAELVEKQEQINVCTYPVIWCVCVCVCSFKRVHYGCIC